MSEPLVIDLDQSAWQAIKDAAAESKWMPPEYWMNHWVADVCRWLKDGPDDAAIPPGYVVVPVEPTEAMMAAAVKANHDHDNLPWDGVRRSHRVYRAMLAERSKP